MLLIIGLGNIGISYKNTYHNMGFMVVDKLSKLLNIKFSHRIGKAKVAIAKDKNLILAKPTTFMNLSGKSVKALLNYFNLTLNDIIIVYDDIDLPKGKIRIRENGSAGTHNGMRNIIETINDDNFIRLRIGIGRPQHNEMLKDYVLGKIPYEDKKILLPIIDKAAKALYKYIENYDIEAMKRDNN